MVSVVFVYGGEEILEVTAKANEKPVLKGDDDWFSLAYSPYSERLGREISWQDDCEEWARSLVKAYENTPTQAILKEDTDPPVQKKDTLSEAAVVPAKQEKEKKPLLDKLTPYFLLLLLLAALFYFRDEIFLKPGPPSDNIITKSVQAENTQKATAFSFSGQIEGSVSSSFLQEDDFQLDFKGKASEEEFFVKYDSNILQGELRQVGKTIYIYNGESWYNIPYTKQAQPLPENNVSNELKENFEIKSYDGEEVEGEDTWLLDIKLGNKTPPGVQEKAWDLLKDNLQFEYYVYKNDYLPAKMNISLSGNSEKLGASFASIDFDLNASIVFSDWGQDFSIQAPAKSESLEKELQEALKSGQPPSEILSVSQ